MKICAACGAVFPTRMLIGGTRRYLNNRRFCLQCSLFGAHNSSRRPLIDPIVRRQQSWAGYSRRRRQRIKGELARSRGGRCEDCGYARSMWALDFHHKDPMTKEFALGGFLGSLERARQEIAKCVLVCANCHRLRHMSQRSPGGHPVAMFRRRLKLRAVAAAGGACRGCRLTEPVAVLDFHHLDPSTKEFAIGSEGIPRSWRRVEAELAKCVLVCANCHREIHAGVRIVERGGPAMSEVVGSYRPAVA